MEKKTMVKCQNCKHFFDEKSITLISFEQDDMFFGLIKGNYEKKLCTECLIKRRK